MKKWEGGILMKRRFAKFSFGLGVLMVALMMLIAFSGCSENEKEITVGDFVIKQLSGDEYYIWDLTEEAKQKTEIIFYTPLEGYNIKYLSGASAGLMPIKKDPPNVYSETLEKVYFIDYIESRNHNFFWGAKNLRKDILVYLSSKDDRTMELFRIKRENLQEEHVNRYIKKSIYVDYSPTSIDLTYFRPANVSYYLNYDKEDSDGYHWIDDYDYGTKITFIPPEPVREDYTFGGWYKEADCLNAWNFQEDTLPEEIIDEETNKIVYQETILYAKWIEN